MLPPIYTILKASSAVTAIVGDDPMRVYRHGSAVQDVTRPYITWSLTSGLPENMLADLPVIDRMAVDIDCWHQTDIGIEELGAAVRAAIEPHGHVTGMTTDLREPDTKLYRLTIQADIWLPRPAPDLSSSSI